MGCPGSEIVAPGAASVGVRWGRVVAVHEPDAARAVQPVAGWVLDTVVALVVRFALVRRCLVFAVVRPLLYLF